MHTPDSNPSTGGVDSPVEERRKVRAVHELAAAMSPVLAQGDARAAEVLVREAERDHPDDAGLAKAAAKCQGLVKRGRWLETALEAMRRDLEEDRFSSALGHFRQALSLSRGLAVLKASVDREAAQQSGKLLPHNWRVAEAILQEASVTEPFFQADATLQGRLQMAREEEAVSNAIYQAERAGIEGRTEEARRQLLELQRVHPDDSRIKERLYALDHPDEETKAPGEKPGASVLEEKTEADGVYSGLAGEEGDENWISLPNPWRTKVVIPNSSWNVVKNLAALMATTAMLGAAGFLVWHHISASAAKSGKMGAVGGIMAATNVAPKPAPEVKKAEPSDKEAWDLVENSNDAAMLREFLNTYPASSHAAQVKAKLGAMEWDKLDKSKQEELEEYLRDNPDTAHKAEAERLITQAKLKKSAVADVH